MRPAHQRPGVHAGQCRAALLTVRCWCPTSAGDTPTDHSGGRISPAGGRPANAAPAARQCAYRAAAGLGRAPRRARCIERGRPRCRSRRSASRLGYQRALAALGWVDTRSVTGPRQKSVRQRWTRAYGQDCARALAPSCWVDRVGWRTDMSRYAAHMARGSGRIPLAPCRSSAGRSPISQSAPRFCRRRMGGTM
jgi:hypothetical protein